MSNQPSGAPRPGSAASPLPPPPPPPPAPVPPIGIPPPPAIQYPPPGYAPVAQHLPPGLGSAKPPRPATNVAGWLMIAGAVVIAVGCFLPWSSFRGESINGFDEVKFYEDDTGIGAAFMLFAVVMLAFGVATLAAKRLLPIMIIGIVVAAISLLGAVAEYSEYRDMFVDSDLFDGDLGAGLPVIGVGSAAALAGAIAGCAKRRRWPGP